VQGTVSFVSNVKLSLLYALWLENSPSNEAEDGNFCRYVVVKFENYFYVKLATDVFVCRLKSTYET